MLKIKYILVFIKNFQGDKTQALADYSKISQHIK